jgi:hypothetical protein
MNKKYVKEEKRNCESKEGVSDVSCKCIDTVQKRSNWKGEREKTECQVDENEVKRVNECRLRMLPRGKELGHIKGEKTLERRIISDLNLERPRKKASSRES